MFVCVKFVVSNVSWFVLWFSSLCSQCIGGFCLLLILVSLFRDNKWQILCFRGVAYALSKMESENEQDGNNNTITVTVMIKKTVTVKTMTMTIMITVMTTISVCQATVTITTMIMRKRQAKLERSVRYPV